MRCMYVPKLRRFPVETTPAMAAQPQRPVGGGRRLGLIPLCLLAAVTYAGGHAWARTGCPITRINDFHTPTHLGTIPPNTEVCVADGVWIEPGERVNVRAEANTQNFSIRLYDQWGHLLTLANRIGGHPTNTAVQGGDETYRSIDNFTIVGTNTFKACIKNFESTQPLSVRYTVDVVGSECDDLPSGCTGARGPNCAFTGLPNTGCYAGALDHDLLRSCAVSVGGHRHDDCCSAHPGGSNCGNVDYDNHPTGDEFETNSGFAPAPLTFSDPHNYVSEGSAWDGSWSYQLCKKEWDMAWGDDTWWLHAVWRDWFDATLMSYRNNPAQRLVNQTGRYWDVGGPTANARKAPLGQQLRREDAAAGWCANGFFQVDDANVAHCISSSGGGGGGGGGGTCRGRTCSQN
jgi:hypothetical protein